MSGDDQGERTEEATPEKRRKAREEGQFPRSRDAGAVAASAAVLISLLLLGSTYVHSVREFAVRCFGSPEAMGRGDPSRIMRDLGAVVLWVMLPGAIAACVGAIGLGLAESGMTLQKDAGTVKWERLNPIPKLGQLFSPKQGLANMTLALLRVAAISLVTIIVLRSEFPNLLKLTRTDLVTGVRIVLDVGLRLASWSILALAVMSGLDFGYSWLRVSKELMMSRQELKEEMQQQEGDPKVKGRMRARAREIARRALAKEVKRADVVVANPTHIAVALRYRPNEGAPMLLAKGYDEVALYMRQLAADHGIPVVENKPLARSIAAKVKVGRMISADLYQAVAQVLALVYRNRPRRWSP